MKIVCSGFYGHGNGGDEAMALALERYLVAPFDNVTMGFATEMPAPDAAQVATENPFYGRNDLISVYDLDTIKEPDIVIVEIATDRNAPALFGELHSIGDQVGGNGLYLFRI